MFFLFMYKPMVGLLMAFEKYNFKSAIPARNRYMVDNSGYAICFVTHSWGGAAKTYERAKKKKLQIINLGAKEDGE